MLIADWIARYKWKRKHEAAMKRYGWDGKCKGCGLWFHTDGQAKAEVLVWRKEDGGDGGDLWRYTCTNCGTVADLVPGIIPMLPIAVEEIVKR